MAQYAYLSVRPTKSTQKPGEFEVSCTNLVGLRNEGLKHCLMGLCELILML